MSRLEGQCHCGGVRAALETSRPPAELQLRACQCGFCRRHGGLTVSDPDGRLSVEMRGPVRRYRFGHKRSDFILCADCGAYLCALTETDIGLLGVLNIRGVDLPGFEVRAPEPMSYDGETPDERLARR